MRQTSLPSGMISHFPAISIEPIPTLSLRLAGTETSPMTSHDRALLDEIAPGVDSLDALAVACRAARVRLVLRTDLEDEGGR